MGIVQKDAFRTSLISYVGVLLGYINKGVLFLIILTQEQIGLISLLITVGTLFAQIASFGTAFTTLKFFPFFKNFENKHHGFLAYILRITFAGIIATTIGFVVFRGVIESWYVEKSVEFVSYYWWVLPIGIGYVSFLLFEAYLRSFMKNILSIFSYEIILRLAVTTSLVLYGFHLISFDSFVKMNSLIYLIPSLILVVYLWRTNEFHVAKRTIKISIRFKRLMYRFSLYNYFNSLGVVLVISLDVMMIAKLVGLEATGIYSTVVFVASALLVPNRSILRISAPLVAEYWKTNNMEQMNDLYKKSASVSLFIGLAGFLIVWLNIDLLFSFLNPAFQPGIWVFFALMMGRLVDMFFGLTGIIFNTSKKFKYDIYFTILLVGVVYFLNLWFIPMWGIVGAAISTAFAFVVYNLGRFIFVNRAYQLNPLSKNQVLVLSIGIASLLIGEWVGSFFTNLWIRSAVVTALFMVGFILPIFAFNLEPQSVSYVKKGLQYIQSKRKK